MFEGRKWDRLIARTCPKKKQEEESLLCSNLPCLGSSMLSRKRVDLALCWNHDGKGEGFLSDDVGSLSRLNVQSSLEST